MLKKEAAAQENSTIKVFRVKEAQLKPYWHYHPEIEIVLVLSGNGFVMIGDHVSRFREGDLIVIGSNLSHNFTSEEQTPSRFVETICIQVNMRPLMNLPEMQIANRLFQLAERGIIIHDIDEIISQDIHQLEGLNPLLKVASFCQLIHAISNQKHKEFALTLESVRLNPGKQESEKMNQALAYIQTNFEQPIQLIDIAQHCNYTTNSFARWFKRQMGVTFLTYLQKIRIAYATNLLVTQDVPISKIAMESGFETPSTFNRVFLKTMKMSPGKYRKLHR